MAIKHLYIAFVIGEDGDSLDHCLGAFISLENAKERTEKYNKSNNSGLWVMVPKSPSPEDCTYTIHEENGLSIARIEKIEIHA